MNEVKAWKAEVAIPTYPVGTPEKNPLFLEKRVYQGSSGVVYPYAVIEKIFDEKIEKVYKALFLENEYLQIMILPELGGRIQMAFDKVKQRHFIYYNQVIKPALVGLTGPWISGGIEFNWPQHHRPSTFEPVDYTIEENADGSKTIWINEVERMFRTKGMAGFTLYPGKAYIEISGKLYNRTPFPQTFLWWANPAVKVNDHYQSVFPPDVYAVFDHGKRDVSSFPIAKGVYYKVDYSPGTDISRYKNIPVPTSYMAIASKYDFIGGYENDSRGGLLHVADHHISPGKKQWTWGHGPFGQAWDRNLTDEDGPYIELMTGVFTDNQPDFSWLQPFEEKTFVQYFMPYSEIGLVKNASKDAMVNIETEEGVADIKLYVTAKYERLQISIVDGENEIFSNEITCSPEKPYLTTIGPDVRIKDGVEVVVTNMTSGKILISYVKEAAEKLEIPQAAKPAKKPSDIEQNEQLYLTGLHLEQYRHATYLATDYYQEALRRDAGDVRCNNALGLWYLKRAQFSKAEPYFRKAIETLTKRNPNPYEGEPFFNLGLALKMQGRKSEAFDVFYKAVWNDAFQHAGYLELARIACGDGRYEEALMLTKQSLVKNFHSHSLRHLCTGILRKLGRNEEALEFANESLAIDSFNFGCIFEKYLLWKDTDKPRSAEVLIHLKEISRGWTNNFIEYAIDYGNAGLFEEAFALLQIKAKEGKETDPMLYYHCGWYLYNAGLEKEATDFFNKAAAMEAGYCFPNRIEDVPVLQMAMSSNRKDAKAPYYLGNLWYDKRQYEDAIACWEMSIQRDESFATAHRNLSLAYFNKLGQPEKALTSLERAFELDTQDARVLMELDQLYKRLNHDVRARLNLLEKYNSLVTSRDDLFLEKITLLNQLEKHNEAKRLLSERKFHPWEGGEGKVVSQHVWSHLSLAKQAIFNEDYDAALTLLEQASNYPENLSEGKLPSAAENDIYYLRGLALEKKCDSAAANRYFKRATEGPTEPVQAIFYNDPQPDKIFYQGLAWLRLGDKGKAEALFKRLIAFGETHLNDHVELDYFAVSLPDLLVFDMDLDLRNQVHCLYLIGLGKLGLREEDKQQLEAHFDSVLELDVNHQGALTHKRLIDFLAATM